MENWDDLDLNDDDFFGDIFTNTNAISTSTTSTSTSQNTSSHLFRTSTLSKSASTVLKTSSVSPTNTKKNDNLISLSSVLLCDDVDLDLDLADFKSPSKNIIEKRTLNENNKVNATSEQETATNSPKNSPNPQFSAVLAKFQRQKTCKSKLSTNKTTTNNIIVHNDVQRVENDEKIYENNNTVNRSTKTPTTKRARKRKFPGPAGLLPPLDVIEKIESSNENSLDYDEILYKSLDSNNIPCSQIDENEFTQGAWLHVQTDIFEKFPSLSKFNIAWLLKQANLKQLPDYEMPILIAAIKSLNINGSIASTVLRDISGEISGTIHKQLLDRGLSLQIGSVVILHRISVFTPNPHSLSVLITPKTLLRIYADDKNGSISCVKLNGDSDNDLNQRLLRAITSTESSIKTPKNSNPTSSSLKISSTSDNLQPTVQRPPDNDEWSEIDDFDELISNINEDELLNP